MSLRDIALGSPSTPTNGMSGNEIPFHRGGTERKCLVILGHFRTGDLPGGARTGPKKEKIYRFYFLFFFVALTRRSPSKIDVSNSPLATEPFSQTVV